MPRAHRPIAIAPAVALCVALGAALGACSSEDPGTSGEEFTSQDARVIVDDARAAMAELDAMRIAGKLDAGGTAIEVDLTINRNGDCSGTLGLEDGVATILGVGGRVWFKPDHAFWVITGGGEENADQLVALAAERWVALPADDTSYTGLCDLDLFLDQILPTDEAAYTRGAVTEFNGTDVVGVIAAVDGLSASTGLVAIEEPHRVLRVSSGESRSQAPVAVDFSDFDVELDLEEPATDDQVDLDELQSQLI